jgi:two-component system, LytTR family, response regulator
MYIDLQSSYTPNAYIEEIQSLRSQVSMLEQSLKLQRGGLSKKVFIGGSANRFVGADEVLRIEASSNYSIIYFQDHTQVFTSKTLKHWQTMFDSHLLIRVHAKHLVNSESIHTIDKSCRMVVLSDGARINYSRSNTNIFINNNRIVSTK